MQHYKIGICHVSFAFKSYVLHKMAYEERFYAHFKVFSTFFQIYFYMPSNATIDRNGKTSMIMIPAKNYEHTSLAYIDLGKPWNSPTLDLDLHFALGIPGRNIAAPNQHFR